MHPPSMQTGSKIFGKALKIQSCAKFVMDVMLTKSRSLDQDRKQNGNQQNFHDFKYNFNAQLGVF